MEVARFLSGQVYWVLSIFFFKQKTAYEIMPSLVGSEMCIRDSLDSESILFIYVSGHGGNEFTKMQDTHVIGANDMAKALEELLMKNDYKKIFYFSDSCEAGTIFNHVEVPNFVGIGSSSKGQYSYARGWDAKIKMSKSDKFTYATHEFWRDKFKYSKQYTLADLLERMTYQYLDGHYHIKSNLGGKKKAEDLPLREYWTFDSPLVYSAKSVDDIMKAGQTKGEEIDEYGGLVEQRELYNRYNEIMNFIDDDRDRRGNLTSGNVNTELNMFEGQIQKNNHYNPNFFKEEPLPFFQSKVVLRKSS
eukprot:TRINITY_DN9524_c0_g1_i1.p1 TRINITY_DN9524_c0_g1~~TRINITY_DN9524_c0_g1_i1.p1  ORF type:complete len:304 (+),score=71.69 TRINITY_DN9524_c0_g1_i1:40-951(+)